MLVCKELKMETLKRRKNLRCADWYYWNELGEHCMEKGEVVISSTPLQFLCVHFGTWFQQCRISVQTLGHLRQYSWWWWWSICMNTRHTFWNNYGRYPFSSLFISPDIIIFPGWLGSKDQLSYYLYFSLMSGISGLAELFRCCSFLF